LNGRKKVLIREAPESRLE